MTKKAAGPSARQRWLIVHRWVALSVGWVLAAVGLMGAILIVAQPLDRRLHPQLFVARTLAPSAGPASPAGMLEAIRQRLVAEAGRDVTLVFRPPRETGETLWVNVRGEPWSGTVYFDPATGEEQGRRGESEGFLNVVFKLHSSLLLKDVGKALLAAIALSYLALLLTGLVLWWPRRWPPSLRIEFGKGLLRGLFDLHRTGGAVLGLLIAVSVASGAYMAWRPLGEFVTAISGGKSIKPPVLPKSSGPTGPIPTLDALAASAHARFPDDPIGYIQAPGQMNKPVRVRMRIPGDPHPNGLTSVWMNPRTGEVIRVDRWNELDLGARAVAIVYPLHTGELGGPVLEFVAMINGLALGSLGISGIWLWWKRRRVKNPATAEVRQASV